MKCTSAHRCVLASCESCCWRAALRISRNSIAADPRQLHSVEFDVKLSVSGFAEWRCKVRNAVEHQRRVNPYFRDTGIWLWLQDCGPVRGIVNLGALKADEFEAVFRRRWPVAFEPIDAVTLREQVYCITRPGVISEVHSGRGGYQAVRFTLSAVQFRNRPEKAPSPSPAEIWLEPLPILL